MSEVKQADIDFLWKMFITRQGKLEDDIKLNPSDGQALRERQITETKHFFNLLSILGKV